MNILKIAGIADGVLLAAVTALGQAVPAWAPYTQVAVEVLGTLGTLLASIPVANARATAPVKP
jgi:hypothetical protein